MHFRFLLPGLLALVLPSANARAAPPVPTPMPITGIPVTVEGTIWGLACLLEETLATEDLANCSRASLAHRSSLAIRESGSGRILAIAAESPASDPAGKAREFIAENVRIQGRLYRRANFSVLLPETIQGIPLAQKNGGAR